MIQLGFPSAKQGYAALRSRSYKRLLKMRQLANELLSEGDESDLTYRFATCIGDLIPAHASEEKRIRWVRETARAVAITASIPLVENLDMFRKRPSLSAAKVTVTEAVAEYWAAVEGTPFAGGVVRTTGSIVVLTRGSAAALLHSVFKVLKLDITPSQIETPMRRASHQLRG